MTPFKKQAEEMLSKLAAQVDIAFENKGQFMWLAQSVIEQALESAFKAGQQSILDRVPSEDEIENEKLNWFGNQLACSNACSIGFIDGANFILSKLKGEIK